MPFTIAQLGGAAGASSLQVLQTDGTVQTLTLPSGVTIDPLVQRGQFAILAQKIVLVRSPSVNLIIDPYDLVVRPLGILPPFAPPNVAAGSAGALTGVYKVKVAFLTKDEGGEVINHSPLSVESAEVTLSADQLLLTNIPISPDAFVNCRRIFRTVAGGSIFFEARDIDDNFATTIEDNTPDAGLALLPEDPDLGNPPGTVPATGLSLIVAWKDRLWARSSSPFEGDRLRYSDINRPYAWPPFNEYLASPVGEDDNGITGFLPRRDELGVCKRRRIMKVVGKDFDPDEGDGEVVLVVEGVGCVAPFSCTVIRDIGYFLGLDGVYTLGADGITCISKDLTDPWFLSDTYFNRKFFYTALGLYNPVTDTYDLFLPSLSVSGPAADGSVILDRWVSYDIRRKQWLGIHRTSRWTSITATAMLRDVKDQLQPTLGTAEGYLVTPNNTGASDVQNASHSAIAIDWITKYFSGNEPDMDHVWLQASFFNKAQAAGTLTMTAKVGDLGAADSAAQSVDMTVDRSRTQRFGEGRLLRLQFTHSTDAQDIELYGLEIPYIKIGRR